MAVSTPLLERRRKISYIHIILVSEPSFSKHPYIRPQARPLGKEDRGTSQGSADLPGPAPCCSPSRCSILSSSG